MQLISTEIGALSKPRRNNFRSHGARLHSKDRSLTNLIEKLNRLYTIYETTDAKLKDEERKLRKEFIDSADGYPQEATIQPMQLKQPQERLTAIRGICKCMEGHRRKGWRDLATAEQAFFTALSASLTKNLPPMYANGKLIVSSDTASTESNPLMAANTEVIRLPHSLAAHDQCVSRTKE